MSGASTNKEAIIEHFTQTLNLQREQIAKLEWEIERFN